MDRIQVNDTLRDLVWQQFGAAIAVLDDAIRMCPDEHWKLVLWDDEDDVQYGQFWFIAYHAVFWIDLYQTGYNEGFLPPEPFVRGRLPDTPYTRDQVLGYLKACRQKVRSTLENLTEEQANRICTYEWIEAAYLEMMLYTMRHVQEHAAHLSLALSQQGVTGFDWVAQARERSA